MHTVPNKHNSTLKFASHPPICNDPADNNKNNSVDIIDTIKAITIVNNKAFIILTIFITTTNSVHQLYSQSSCLTGRWWSS